MTEKIGYPDKPLEYPQIGATLDALSSTIAARRGAGESSYTWQLLNAEADKLLKKVGEEALEVALAAKDVEALAALRSSMAGMQDSAGIAKAQADEDAALDHLRYEAADVVYHLMVVLERYGIELDELAAELNARMTDEERPQGGVFLKAEYINRGK